MAILRAGLVTVGLLLVWEAAVRLFALPPFILPSPVRVAGAFQERGVYLLENTLVTLSEILLGFVLGSLLGAATALAMSAVPLARRLILPVGMQAR
mgnify:FL=1